jgi:hypothetical protein
MPRESLFLQFRVLNFGLVPVNFELIHRSKRNAQNFNILWKNQ